MKRVFGKGYVILFILCVMMCSFFIPTLASTEEASNLLENGGFESSIWSDDSAWKNDFEWSDNLQVSQTGNVSFEGNQLLHFYCDGDKTIKLTQEVSLAAGKYSLSSFMAGNNVNVHMYVLKKGETSNLKESDVQNLSSWDAWKKNSTDFEVTEEGTYIIGLYIDIKSGGYGDIDNVVLKTYSENETDTTNLAKSADFEDSDMWVNWTTQVQDNNWENTSFEQASDSYHKGSKSLSFYTKTAKKMKVNQKVSLEPGTYELSGYMEGKYGSIDVYTSATDSVKNVTLGQGVWKKGVLEFTVTNAGEYEIGFLINAEVGDEDEYGHIDQVSLKLKLGSSGDPGSSKLLENGGFEEDIWTTNTSWKVSPDSFDENDMTITQPSTHPYEGEKSLSYWTKSAKDIKVYQEVKLDEGQYILSASVSGLKNTPTLFCDVNDSRKSFGLEGYDTFKKGKLIFNVETAGTYNVGLILKCKDGGWGYVDDVKLEKYTEDTDDINVKKVEGLPSDFIKGADVSSVISLEEAGVKYKNADGVEEDFFKILHDSGVNYVRVRVWNNPKDSNGNSYGGGNCDVNNAAKIGARASKYNIKLCVDFHYSDFWAHPGNQNSPKEWENYSADKKAAAISDFTAKSLKTIKDAGGDIGMVQLGNETVTTGAGSNMLLCDESNWDNVSKMLKAGTKAVRNFDSNVKIILNPTHVQYVDKVKNIAIKLDEYNIDYDIFAVSYYMFWHGSLDNMVNELNKVVNITGKDVMIGETSYPYTSVDSDGHSNRVSALQNDMIEPISVEGQANAIRDVIVALTKINNNKGAGIFYWGGELTTVGSTVGLEGDEWSTQFKNNQLLWEKYGCGWATHYAGSYAPNAKKYYGGTDFDNQALFDSNGTALESLNVFKYIDEGSNYTGVSIDSVEGLSISLVLGEDSSLTLPSKVHVIYSDKTEEDLTVTWNETAKNKVNLNLSKGIIGRYNVTGILSNKKKTVVCMKVDINPKNYVSNYGFENGVDNWIVDTNGSHDISEAEVLSGSKSLKFGNDASYTVSIKQSLNNLTSGLYNISANAKNVKLDKECSVKFWYEINGKKKEMLVDLSDGTWVDSTFKKIKINSGDKVNIGYTVSGEGGSYGYIDNVSLYKPTLYSLKYYRGVGAKNVSKLPSTISTYIYNDKAIVSRGVTSTNKFFIGWNTSSSGTGKTYSYAKSYIINDNTKLYAKWSTYYTASNKVKYKVVGRNKVSAVGVSSKNIKYVKIPSTIKVSGITYKVTSVKAKAFKNCKKLKKVVIGNNVRYIGDRAFYGCLRLKSVSIGKNTIKLGKYVLQGTAKKVSIKIYSKKIVSVKSVLNNKKATMRIRVPSKKVEDYKKLLKINKMKKEAIILKL